MRDVFTCGSTTRLNEELKAVPNDELKPPPNEAPSDEPKPPPNDELRIALCWPTRPDEPCSACRTLRETAPDDCPEENAPRLRSLTLELDALWGSPPVAPTAWAISDQALRRNGQNMPIPHAAPHLEGHTSSPSSFQRELMQQRSEGQRQRIQPGSKKL
jgi:hypothetical protein